MKLVFLGPPGAGKGTAAAEVVRALGITHISTGDMFRQAIGKGTPTGLKAKAFIDAGALVPDAVVIEMVRERLSEADCANGYLLDGFPRTVEQAEALGTFSPPDVVIDLVVPDELLVSRLTGRRVCGACKGTFHINRLEDGRVCPVCQGELIQRADDSEETIAERLAVYHEQTSPLTDYYKDKNILKAVDAIGTPEEVLARVLSALGTQA